MQHGTIVCCKVNIHQIQWFQTHCVNGQRAMLCFTPSSATRVQVASPMTSLRGKKILCKSMYMSISGFLVPKHSCSRIATQVFKSSFEFNIQNAWPFWKLNQFFLCFFVFAMNMLASTFFSFFWLSNFLQKKKNTIWQKSCSVAKIEYKYKLDDTEGFHQITASFSFFFRILKNLP